jgi:OOP family OmpA-OmpF porin
MRSICFAAASMIALAMPVAASAQSAPKATRSAEQIVCELTGECGKANLDESKRLRRPEEAAFSFSHASTAAPVATGSARREARSNRRMASRAAARSVARAPRAVDMRMSFALGSAELTDQSRAEAQSFARALAMPALSGKRFTVAGHTDSIGTHDDNMRLSQARAESVTAYLKTLGVDGARLTAKGFGPDSPLPGRSAGAAANRRVEIVPEGVAVASSGM